MEMVAEYRPDIVLEQRVYRLLPRAPQTSLADIEASQHYFEVANPDFVSVLHSIKTKNIRARFDSGSRVYISQPGWRSEAEFSIPACYAACFARLTISTAAASRFRLSLLDTEKNLQQQEKIFLKDGLNTLYMKLDKAVHSVVLDRWENAADIEIRGFDVGR
ncbi:MAG: hypothetical protein KDI30_02645 [Pseudomonadales bacterium]|nr:hypothetical protein [Pseudomonadales bacterium]